MSILKDLLNLVRDCGRSINEQVEEENRRKSDYDSTKYGGQWINVGTRYDEKWVWKDIEKDIKLMYVSVLQNDKHYTIQVEYTRNPNAIEECECEDMEMVQDAIDLFEVYYESFGDVTINRKLEE